MNGIISSVVSYAHTSQIIVTLPQLKCSLESGDCINCILTTPQVEDYVEISAPTLGSRPFS